MREIMKRIAIGMAVSFVPFGASAQTPPFTLFAPIDYGPYHCDAVAVAVTQEDEIVFAGSYGDWSAILHPYLTKITLYGTNVWTRTYGDFPEFRTTSMTMTHDGGFILVGRSDTQSFLLRADVDGNELWSQVISDSLSFRYTFRKVKETRDGGYLAVGFRDSSQAGNEGDYITLRTDSAGRTVWFKSYGHAGNDAATSFQELADSTLLVAGNSTSFGGNSMIYVLKLDSRGDTLWTKIYGGPGNNYCNAVCAGPGKSFYLAGSTDSFGSGGLDVYLIRAKYDGDTLWTSEWGGSGDEQAMDAFVTGDGGCVGGGYTTSLLITYSSRDFLVVKFDSAGSASWVTHSAPFDPSPYAYEQLSTAYAINSGQSGEMGIAGVWQVNGAYMRRGYILIGRLDAGPSGIRNERSKPQRFMLAQNYPNPFNPSTTIPYELPDRVHVLLTVFNMLGQKVASLVNTDQTAGHHEVRFDGSGLASGVYLYRLEAGDNMQTRKLLLLR